MFQSAPREGAIFQSASDQDQPNIVSIRAPRGGDFECKGCLVVNASKFQSAPREGAILCSTTAIIEVTRMFQSAPREGAILWEVDF